MARTCTGALTGALEKPSFAFDGASAHSTVKYINRSNCKLAQIAPVSRSSQFTLLTGRMDSSKKRDDLQVRKVAYKCHAAALADDSVRAGTLLARARKDAEAIDDAKKRARALYRVSTGEELLQKRPFTPTAPLQQQKRQRIAQADEEDPFVDQGGSSDADDAPPCAEAASASAAPRSQASEEEDDVCAVCGDGGALVQCDCCKRFYHCRCGEIPRLHDPVEDDDACEREQELIDLSLEEDEVDDDGDESDGDGSDDESTDDAPADQLVKPECVPLESAEDAATVCSAASAASDESDFADYDVPEGTWICPRCFLDDSGLTTEDRERAADATKLLTEGLKKEKAEFACGDGWRAFCKVSDAEYESRTRELEERGLLQSASAAKEGLDRMLAAFAAIQERAERSAHGHAAAATAAPAPRPAAPRRRIVPTLTSAGV